MKEKLEIIVSNFSFQVQYASQPITVQTKTQYVNSHGSLTANCLMNVPMNRIQMESKYTPLFDISKEVIIYMDRGQKSSRNNNPLLLTTLYLKTGDQKQKAKIVFCVCHGPEKGSKYHLETIETTFNENNMY